jgi:hypothetical protein
METPTTATLDTYIAEMRAAHDGFIEAAATIRADRDAANELADAVSMTMVGWTQDNRAASVAARRQMAGVWSEAYFSYRVAELAYVQALPRVRQAVHYRLLGCEIVTGSGKHGQMVARIADAPEPGTIAEPDGDALYLRGVIAGRINSDATYAIALADLERALASRDLRTALGIGALALFNGWRSVSRPAVEAVPGVAELASFTTIYEGFRFKPPGAPLEVDGGTRDRTVEGVRELVREQARAENQRRAALKAVAI